jgi:hypothetical protein
MDAEDDGQATPSEVQDLNRDEEAPSEFAVEIEKFRVYLSYRTPTAVLMGGTTGGDFITLCIPRQQHHSFARI